MKHSLWAFVVLLSTSLLTTPLGPQKAFAQDPPQPEAIEAPWPHSASISAAAGDFDEDGRTDLVVGYRSDAGGGVLTIFSAQPRGGFRPTSLRSPVAPAHLATGDFDGDGHLDIVLGSPEIASLYLLAGDGGGGVGPAVAIPLPGRPTALLGGEILERPTMSDNVVVAVDREEGPALLLFETLRPGDDIEHDGLTEVQAPVTAFTSQHLVGDPGATLVALAGGEVFRLSFEPRRGARVETGAIETLVAKLEPVPLETRAAGIALGDFLEPRGLDLAWLSDAGELRVQPLEPPVESQAAPCRIEGELSGALLLKTRLSAAPGDDLLVVGRDASEARLLRSTGAGSCLREAGSLALEGGVETILSFADATSPLHHLMILDGDRREPRILASVPEQTFRVNTLDDLDDGVCEPGHCSLREAIASANRHPGQDRIELAIGRGAGATIRLTSTLPVITDPVILDATTEPGYLGSPLVILDGTGAGPETPGLLIRAGFSTVRGLALQGFGGAGLTLTEGGSNVISGNRIRGNGVGLLVASGSNQIGGATSEAGNLISGNPGGNLILIGEASVGNRVEGNRIGAASVKAPSLEAPDPLSGDLIGVLVTGGASGNRIGSRGAGNEIAFHRQSAVVVESGSKNLIELNRIHTNGEHGILLLSPTANRLLSNQIDGNGREGIAYAFSVTQRAPEVPEIRSAVVAEDGTARVVGTLSGAPDNRYTVELFASTTCDASGFGEGQMPLATLAAWTDSTGVSSFSHLLPTRLAAGTVITATAIDEEGTTSAFSQCSTVTTNVVFGCPSSFGPTVKTAVNTPVEVTLERFVSFRTLPSHGVLTFLSSTGGPLPDQKHRYTPDFGFEGFDCVVYNSCLQLVNNRCTEPDIRAFNFQVGTGATLTVSKSGTGGGTVTSSPLGINCGSDCTQKYNFGTAVTLTASPSTSSTFGGWSGCDSVSGTTCVVTLNNARSVTATFNIKSFRLTVSKGGTGSGTVTSSPAGISCGSDCLQDYNFGTLVTLSASPSTSSAFGGWSGCNTVSGATCTVTMTSNRNVTAVFTLKNAAPIASNDAYAAREDTTLSIAAPGVLGNDSDGDGDPLTASLVSGPSNGTLTLNANGSFSYRARLNFNGVDSFTYRAQDPSGASDTASVSITVLAVNDPPVAGADSATTPEDQPVDIAVLANDSDVDHANSLLVVSAVGTPSHGTAVVLSDGRTVRYTPNADFNGSDAFPYTVSDPAGASSSAAVSITVLPVNDTPLAFDDSVVTNEGELLAIPVLANDRDVDGDAIVIHSFDASSVAGGTITLNDDGTLIYTPPAGFRGQDTFTYDIRDTAGAVSPRATVTVLVNGFPLAADDAALTQRNEAVVIDVLANDSDPDGDAIELNSFDELTAAEGTVTLNADGTFTYQPPFDFVGDDSFTYDVRDVHGAVSNRATVLVHVNGAPVANDDSALTEQGQSVGIPALANDTDPDGDTLAVHTFDATSAHGGSAALNTDGTFTYQPAAGFVGDDAFTYDLQDVHGTVSNRATVSVHVNGAPVPADDVATLDEDTSLEIAVLANDTDPDGDALKVLGVASPTHGTAVLLASQQVRYTPAANFHGTDAFTYTLTDAHGTTTATATVSLTILPVNDAPTPVCQDLTRPADGACQAAVAPVEVDAGSSDIDGDPLSFSLAPAGPFGLGQTGVTLTADDGQGELNSTASCSATITVVDVSQPAISCPADIVTVTQDPAIAVTFDLPLSTDNCTTAPLVACTPPPGDLFPVGTTTVGCSALDESGNSSVCSFTVEIRTPAEQAAVIESIIQDLIDAGILKGKKGTGLLGTFTNVDNIDCNTLRSFVNHLEGMITSGTLTPEEGALLLEAVALLQDGLGC